MAGPRSYRVRHLVVIFCAEFLGTAYLLIFGCMGCNASPLTPTQMALAWGFTVTSVITFIGHLTQCHINPCVTVCALLLGLIRPLTALVYFVAQMLGAIFGFYLVLVLTKDSLMWTSTEPDAAFCLTTLRSTVTVPEGILCEFIATSLLCFAVCSAFDRRNALWGDAVPIKIGTVVAILIYSINKFTIMLFCDSTALMASVTKGSGQLTGASLNPARSFAPALLYMKWKNQWIYWVSTLGAAIFSTLIYKFIFLARVGEEIIVKKDAIVVNTNNPKSPMTEIKDQSKMEIGIREDPTLRSKISL